MKQTFVHAGWMILELLRQPSYVVSTIAFPALFYVIFALPESKDVASSNLLLASFACFAVFGVIFLQFGVGIAQERTKSWYYYLRTLPIGSLHLIAARFLSAIFFSFLAALAIVMISVNFTEVSMTVTEWGSFAFYLLLGGLSFCTMGLALGYWTSEKSSLPVGNLIYLPMTFVGGLWKPPSILPEMLQDVSSFLPTRHYGEMLWAVVRGDSVDINNIVYLFAYSLVFAVIAYWGFNRDVRVRFG
jgi:ABC-2 type transport system permease protein